MKSSTITKELDSRTDRELLLLCVMYGIKPTHRAGAIGAISGVWGESRVSSADMPFYGSEGCDNSVDPATMDDESDHILKSNGGICWDSESLARYIIQREGSDNYDNAVLEGIKKDVVAVKNKKYEKSLEDFVRKHKPNAAEIEGGLDSTKVYDKKILRQLLKTKAIPKDVRKQLKRVTSVDLTAFDRGFMELLLKTGQILQNVGPAWDSALEAELNELNDAVVKERLQTEWNTVRRTTTELEPPRNMSVELKDLFDKIKLEAFIVFADAWDQLSSLNKIALSELNSNLTDEKISKCRLGQHCVKILSTSLLQAYNKWAKVVKEQVYDYRSELDNVTIRIAPTTAPAIEGATRANDLSTVDGPENGRTLIRLYEQGIRNFGIDEINGVEADLSGADLSGANLSGVDLSGADLRRVNFSDSNLIGANFQDAVFRRSNLTGADLTNANLRNANLVDTDLTDTDLRGADLTFADLTHANLANANLRGARFTSARLTNVTISVHTVVDGAIGWLPGRYTFIHEDGRREIIERNRHVWTGDQSSDDDA